MPRFPNLFIIGAMKAGTSSLHEYLHQHPDIFMSRVKEPQFFAPKRLPDGSEWDEGLLDPDAHIEWYRKLFATAGPVEYAGESSTSYTKLPWSVGCADRIYAHNPQARLIYLVRNPVERTISHYWHNVRYGVEPRPLLRAISEDARYTAYSQYATQLAPYLDRFPRSSIFLVTLEELVRKPQPTFRRIFDWLGIESSFTPCIAAKENVGPRVCEAIRPTFAWTITLTKHWRFRQIARATPTLVADTIRRVCFKKVDRLVDDTTKAREVLRVLVERECVELSRLFGRALDEWEQSAESLQGISVESLA